VDLHAHVLVPEVEDLVAECPEKKAETELARRVLGAESAAVNQRQLQEVGPKLTDVSLRLQLMDTMGVDLQVLSPIPSQYYYWASEDLAAELVRLQNERLAELSARLPARLAALGNVALQCPRLAVEQMKVAVRKLGLSGVEISTGVNQRDLGDAFFDTFWAAAEDLGCLVFIHPWGSSLGERTSRYYLANVIGQPLETTIALSDMIFSGVFDRRPGLKILAAHGGGYLPSYIGRSDQAFGVRPEAKHSRRQPSEYLRQIYFDSLLYAPESLRRLIDQVGVSQVVIGTDYPFDMGHYDPHGLIAALAQLTEDERNAILGGNAARLLRSCGWRQLASREEK
jgi:aminocarboxymuconate-semialdehyde decarboxylase